MGCMCENPHAKHKPRKKLLLNSQAARNKLKTYENVYRDQGIDDARHNGFNRATRTATTTPTATATATPSSSTSNRINADHLDEVGHLILSKLVQLSNNISNKTYVTNSSHYLVRHSLSLYAASSVILALCYLTSAAAKEINPMLPPSILQPDPEPMLPEPRETDYCNPDTFRAKNYDLMDRFNESCSDKEILDHLLGNSRYDKRLIPPVNDEDFCCGLSSPEMANNLTVVGPTRPQNRGTLTVNVNVLLLSLASPDESSLKYEVEFLLNQQWKDPRLQYGNQSKFDYLNAIHHYKDIWLPDTYFIMHGDFKDPINPMHFALRIYRNGTITYSMRRHLILSCQGSLNIFPFDDPLCSFAMESISYEQSQIKYVWKNDEATLRKSPSLTTLNAYLIKNQTIPCPIKNSWRGNYSCLKVDLIFTRDRAFYFTTVFIPGIILVTSSFITFWLEWNAVPARSMIGNYSCLKVDLTFTRDRAFYFTTVFIPGIILVTSSFITFWLEWNAVPARVMIGVTTMLNFFTTSNGFRSTLPVVSNLTAMNVWDGVCMCFIYASLLEFVCVNYVGRKRPLHNVVYRPGENPVTQRLPAVLSRIGIILASPLGLIEQEFRAALAWERGKRRGTPQTPAKTTPQVATSVAGGKKPKTKAKRTASTNTPTRAIATSPHEDTPGPAGTELVSTPPSIMVTASSDAYDDIERGETGGQCPVKPPRRKGSRLSATPTRDLEAGEKSSPTCPEIPEDTIELKMFEGIVGEKKRDAGGPNEIVACTSCGGGTSPCTHSANNGCATETCFVQVRKKEPPHPIRVAKTIDVIARITFPTAYAIFLIFFFIHYKAFT